MMIFLFYLFPLYFLILIYLISRNRVKNDTAFPEEAKKEVVYNKKIKLVINIIYFLGIVAIIALMAYAEYCARSWARGGWNGIHWPAPPIPLLHHILRLEPFNGYVAYAIAAGTLPMGIATIFYERCNNILKKKYPIIKRLLAWLPACYCMFMAGHIVASILISGAMAAF